MHDINSITYCQSLLIFAPYWGYVLSGVIAFALGIAVTLLCVHLKELKKERELE